MKIYCNNCKKYLGEILNGSKLRKNIKHYCEECAETLESYQGFLNTPRNSAGDQQVFNDLMDIMKGKK